MEPFRQYLMDLYILRHAIAEERNPSGRDSERRLTDEGREKMRNAAKGMKSLDLEFDLILSSPYARAKETAEIVAKVFDADKVLRVSPTLAADGNPKELVDELKREHKECKSILLVGHEPYFSRLISLLISGDTAISIVLKKGGLCKLSTKKLYYGRCATLEWLLMPGQMRKLH